MLSPPADVRTFSCVTTCFGRLKPGDLLAFTSQDVIAPEFIDYPLLVVRNTLKWVSNDMEIRRVWFLNNKGKIVTIDAAEDSHFGVNVLFRVTS